MKQSPVFLLIQLIIASVAVADPAEIDTDMVLKGLGDSLQTVSCGEFHFSAEMQSKAPEQDDVDRWVQQMDSALVAAATDAQDLEQMRKQLTEQAPGHLAAIAHRKLEYYVAVQGVEPGNDIYVEMAIFAADGTALAPRTTFLSRIGGDLSQSIYKQDGKGRCGYPVSMGRVDPYRMGRVHGQFADRLMAADDSIRGISVAELPDGFLEVSCEFTNFADQKRECRLVCDPARGFIVTEQEERDSEGTSRKKWLASNFFSQNSVWFPATFETRTNDAAGESDKITTVTYSFSEHQVRLNHKPPMSRFSVELPPGRRFYDYRSQPPKPYQVHSPVDLTLDMLDEIGSVAGFSPALMANIDPAPSESVTSRNTGLLLIVNIVAVLLIVVFAIARKRSLLIVGPVMLYAITGCSGQPDGPHERANKQPFVVVPPKIRLGKISAEGGSCEFTFRVRSTVTEPLPVSILSSCNCTTSGQEKVLIQPDEEQVVSLQFDPRGKLGVVETVIGLEWTDASDNIRSVAIPFSAEVERSWSARPSRVLIAENDSGLVVIRGPIGGWMDATVTTSEGLGIELVWTEQEGAYETRHFKISPGDLASAVFVTLNGQNSACLTIPVLSQ